MIASDKDYWHRYLPEYERVIFAKMEPEAVLEFGVFLGESIRWLAAICPKADIYGVDIIPNRSEWPRSPRIHYIQADQGDAVRIKDVFRQLGRKLDVVIEDGSHLAEHQANCLKAAMGHVRSGGFYVAEDLHAVYGRTRVTLLHVLLALKRSRELGCERIDSAQMCSLGEEFFTLQELADLNEWIAEIHTYRRSCLPLRCYNCGGATFDYAALRCSCGVDVYSAYDSISFILKVA